MKLNRGNRVPYFIIVDKVKKYEKHLSKVKNAKSTINSNAPVQPHKPTRKKQSTLKIIFKLSNHFKINQASLI